MYKEKLDHLFRRAAGDTELIIEHLKQLVHYQNFCVEQQILLQARNNGVDISPETLMQKDRQRILEHDKAISSVCSINSIAKANGCGKIFDFEPHLAEGKISKFEQDDHRVVGIIVADFINEYYNLGLQMSREGLDDTTFYQTKKVSEKEWFGATENTLPKVEYDKTRLDNAPENIKNDIDWEEKQLSALKEVINKNKIVSITLYNGVEMSITKNNDFDVTLRTDKEFTRTSGILRDETNAGFEQTGEKEMSAKDILLNQINEIIKDNGGISYESVKEYHLDKNMER